MSTERVGLSVQTASTRPAARWQSESASRAHDPQAVRELGDLRRVGRDEIGVASPRTTRISIASFGRDGAERLAVQPRALAAPADPLLAAAEVVDEAEVDVVHRPAVGDGDREGEERDAALRVERAVDRVDHEDRVGAFQRGRAPPRRSRRRSRGTARRSRPRPPCRSRSSRRRPRPSPTTGSRSARVGSRSSTASTSATAARQSSSQSVKRQASGGRR